MKKILSRSSISFISLALPASVFAQGTGLTELFVKLTESLEKLIPIIIGFALLTFIWGIARYIMMDSAGAKRQEAIKIIVYGLVSLLVITAVWGFVEILGIIFLSATTLPAGQ